jgi:hypothetical protein
MNAWLVWRVNTFTKQKDDMALLAESVVAELMQHSKSLAARRSERE